MSTRPARKASWRGMDRPGQGAATAQSALPVLARRLLRGLSAAPSGEYVQRLAAGAYPGSRRRRYTVFVPRGLPRLRRAPLVVVLHGCLQSDAQLRQVSDFDALAGREGFIVAYPSISAGSGLGSRGCWPWWESNEIAAGAGAVQDLWQIVRAIQRDFPVDPRRIHVAGLSAGGAMAVAMLVAHAGALASGCSVAGLPYGESASALTAGRFRPVSSIVNAMRAQLGAVRPPPPLMVVHASGDATVDITAARHLRDSWLQCSVPAATPRLLEHSGEIGGVRWQHAQYFLETRRSQAETVLLEGLGHGWIGGQPGAFSFPGGPNISGLMWDFFLQHPLA